MATDAWLTLLSAAQQVSPRAWLDALKRCGSAEALRAAPTRLLLECGVAAEPAAKLKTPDEQAIERWRAMARRAAPRTRHVRQPRVSAPPAHSSTTRRSRFGSRGPSSELLAAPQLAIVGSRSPTTGGRETAEQFARYLGERGLTITSGLATGIDGASHRGALAVARGHRRRARLRHRRRVSPRARAARGRHRGTRAARLGIRARRRAAASCSSRSAIASSRACRSARSSSRRHGAAAR